MDGQSSLYKLPKRIPSINYSTKKKLANAKINKY